MSSLDHLIRAKFRVKLRSLAEEARIIRSEEARACKYKSYGTCNSLHEHRVGILREEARCAQIAYAFWRGVPYGRVEKTEKPVNFNRVLAILKSLSYSNKLVTDVVAWIKQSWVTA